MPFGVLLSGGLDSSLVASVIARLRRKKFLESGNPADLQPLKSFSIGLDGSPDLVAAQKVLTYLLTCLLTYLLAYLLTCWTARLTSPHHAPMHAPCTHACTPRLTLSLALGDGVLSRVLPCSRERMTPDITAMRAHCACSLTIAMHCNVGEQGCARAVGLEVVLSH